MPERKIDFFSLSKLDFLKPDHETFKGIKLAVDSYNRGYIYTTVFNAANDGQLSPTTAAAASQGSVVTFRSGR